MISIVLPTYKEAENISFLLERIFKTMKVIEDGYEIIIVDDNSKDGIEEIVDRFSQGGLPVRIIVRMNERGLSSAVICGFQEAKGDVLVCMDADMSHPPTVIPQLVEALRDGETEFCIGSRYVPGASTDETWGQFRWLNSKVATLLARPFTSAKDPLAGFFAIPADVFRRQSTLCPIGYKIGLELIVKQRVKKVSEVPIHFTNRQFGQSKLNLREQLNYIRHIKHLAKYKFNWFSRLNNSG
jgi:dolichol-phosphate mannosyltransferase